MLMGWAMLQVSEVNIRGKKVHLLSLLGEYKEVAICTVVTIYASTFKGCH
jgi:hypothetical protein